MVHRAQTLTSALIASKGCSHIINPGSHSTEQPDTPRNQADEFIPVVIVGAGPTGLAAANLLGAAGIPALIIERNVGLSDIPKAIALDDEGLRIFQAMGLSSVIGRCVVSDIPIDCLSEGRLLAKLVPMSKRNGFPLISTFHQPELEATLLDGLRHCSCVDIRFQHTVETLEQNTDCVVVSIRTPSGTLQRIRCAYLLACDGGKSAIRSALNIPLRGKTFAQKWLVIDAISKTDSRAALKIYCDPQRPAVSIPTPHNGRRWEFMLLPGETEEEMLAPATISALLQQADASPHTQIIRRAIYTFHAALAKTFSQGRIFLLGDAAHMMPPFGGQGLNSGLRDVHNLVWKVAMVLQDHAAARLLATYHQERSRHATHMVAFASFLGTLFMSTARPLAFCRNLLIRILFALPIVRGYLSELHIKPQAKYTAGFFLWDVAGKSLGGVSRKNWWRIFKGPNKRIVGTLLPQPEVITEHGQRVLLDEVLGTGFALLRCHSNPQEAFAALKTDFWERLGARFVCIQTDDTRRGQLQRARVREEAVHQDNGRAEAGPYGPLSSLRLNQPLSIVVVRSMDNNFLRKSRDHFIVVRPDRFILGVFKEKKADAFTSAFQRFLSSQ